MPIVLSSALPGLVALGLLGLGALGCGSEERAPSAASTSPPSLTELSWSFTGPVAGQGGGRTTTTLLDGRILLVGGPQAYLYDPATASFSPTGPMNVTRSWHSATLLANGKVLVAGDTAPSSAAEIYDPTTNAWTLAAPMPSPRYAHTATMLPDGTVLVVGGYGVAISCPSPQGSHVNMGGDPTAVIYNPVADAWTVAAPPQMLHENGSAAQLPDGRVLLLGGFNDTVPGSVSQVVCTSDGLLEHGSADVAELYDPASNAWSTAPSPTFFPYDQGALVLPSGDVMVIDTRPREVDLDYVSAEIYHPATSSWTLTSYIGRSHGTGRAATVLSDGRVLVVGGNPIHGTNRSHADLYNPAIDRWTSAGETLAPREDTSIAALPGGKALIAFGQYPSYGAAADALNAEVFDPSPPSPASPCLDASGCASGFCVDGFCCDSACTGGGCSACSVAAGALADGVCTALQEGFSCPTGTCQSGACSAGATWQPTVPMLSLHGYNLHTTRLADGRVLVTPGSIAAYPSSLSRPEVYDQTTGQWSNTAPMQSWHVDHSATRLLDGRILVLDNTPEIYDPLADTWTSAAACSREHPSHTAVRLASGRVLVVGGLWGGKAADIYDPITNTWSGAAPTAVVRWVSSAVLLPTGKALVMGGAPGAPPSPELFDETTGTWAPAAAPATPFSGQQLTLLPNGKVLLVAWGAAELYDPLTNTWSFAAPPPPSFSATLAPVVLLDTGLALVAGGQSSSPGNYQADAGAYAYDPQADAWTTVEPMVVPRIRFGLAPLPNGGALAVGGFAYALNHEISSVTAEVYPPSSIGSSSAASGSGSSGGAGGAASSSSGGAGGAASSSSGSSTGGAGGAASSSSGSSTGGAGGAASSSSAGAGGAASNSSAVSSSGAGAGGAASSSSAVSSSGAGGAASSSSSATSSSSSAVSSSGAGGAASSSSSATSSSSVTSSSGAGGAANSSSSAASSSSSSAASSSSSSEGAGGAGPGSDMSASSGCSASPGPAASSPWLGLVLLALLRRRRLATR